MSNYITERVFFQRETVICSQIINKIKVKLDTDAFARVFCAKFFQKGARILAYGSKKQNNVYKQGKLSKSMRFTSKSINWTLIIVIICVLASFIFAVVLGNALGDMAENSQNTTDLVGGTSNLGSPTVDKVPPTSKLHAYFADMSEADPNISLSAQTEEARNSGNALFIDMRDGKGVLTYSSDKAEELGFSCRDNLTLKRLYDHFSYWDDHVVGYFESDFAASLTTEERLDVIKKESLLLQEATEDVFDQIIIKFSGEITRYNISYYQSYLLELKLACPQTPIGVQFSLVFISDTNNSVAIAQLLEIADFYALDLGEKDSAQIGESLTSLVYFFERYNGVVMLTSTDKEAIEERIASLESKGAKSYIVK